MIPMTEITPEDLRVKAESIADPMVARMLTEAADAIDILRSEAATLRCELQSMVSAGSDETWGSMPHTWPTPTLNPKQEAEFQRIVTEGRIRVDLVDALRELFEEVSSDGWSRGIDQATDSTFARSLDTIQKAGLADH